MHDVVMFLCVLVLAVMVVTVVGTVGGLLYARSLRPHKVACPTPSKQDVLTAIKHVGWCMERQKLPELEAVLTCKGHVLPTELREVAWRWLNAAQQRQSTNKTATS